MSRTYREIPGNRYRDRDSFHKPLEERRHAGHTDRVRDKDNHGFPYSCPKAHRKSGIRRHRACERDSLREIEQMMWRNPTKKIGDNDIRYISFEDTEITLPRPKEYQEYYW